MEGSFHGYPRRLFLIDTCPLGSTSGQVIALGKFLEQYWPEYSRFWNLARNPNIIIVSSSYHVPRVELSFGCNSPLLTAEFWLYRLDLFNKLDETMRNYALSQGTTLRKASIWVIGCDREITENPSWERDLYGDMQAVVNYASRHRFSFFPNSSIIANRPGENIRTAADLIIKGNLYNRLTLDRQTVNVDQEEEKSSTISLS
nr:hypothetical protein [Legionella jordanis]